MGIGDIVKSNAREVDFVNSRYEAYAAYLAGRIALANGDAALAREAFGQALAITEGALADRVGQARARLQLAQIEADAARPDAAWAQATQARALLQDSQARRDEMQAHQLLGQLAKARGEFALALHHHEAFHAGYERSFNDESARKARLLAVRHEVDLARADAQRERAENARLTDALAEISARLRLSEGQDLAPPALPSRPEDLRGLGLTSREAEVLFSVTQGKTNDEVTLILGASVSVVKKHLGRIYDKLGVDNRTAAADAVRRCRSTDRREPRRSASSDTFGGGALLTSSAMHPFYLLLLAAGLLVFVSLLAGVASARLGLPFLLVFLVAGMLVGVDGPIGIRFDNAQLGAWVGNAALAIILLEGGISTRMTTFRVGLPPALVLATLGVVLTAAIVGAVAMTLLKIDWRLGLLLGAIVGSTDAAAVFSLLRQTGVRLSERVSATLELESGLNDPMAVFLVLALIATVKSDSGFGETALLFVRQAGFGALIGLAGGWGVSWLLDRLPLDVEHGGVLSLIVVSAGIALFATCGLVEGSGFLAIYLFGICVRARAEKAAHAASSALDGFAWAAQASLFLLLGVLVSPHDLLSALGPTLGVAAVLIFVARPLAVWLCLWPMGFDARARLFIGWVGLRGAVPIVLALFPLLAKVPDSYRFFNVAFAVTLASLLLQGTTLGWVARRLGMVEPPESPPPEHRAVQGRLTIDADLPLADVFSFFQLPMPEHGGTSLRDWLTDNLARDHVEGDGIDWHGAHFRVLSLQDGRIARVGLALAQKAVSTP